MIGKLSFNYNKHLTQNIKIIFIITLFWNVKTSTFSQSDKVEVSENTFVNNVDFIKICKWKNGAKGCVVFSFDDNCKKHLEIARLFDTYNFRATFFVNSSNMLIDSLKQILVLGNEIGNHTYSHKSLTELDSSEVDFQIRNGKNVIEKALNTNCFSFAEPFHHRSKLTSKIAFNNHLFVRDYSEYPNVKHNVIESSTKNLINFTSILNKSILYGKLLQVTGHSIDNEAYLPLKKATLKCILDTIQLNVKMNNIWIAKNMEAIQYENLYHEVTLSRKILGDTLILTFKNYNNKKYYKMPNSMISVEIPYTFSKYITPITDSILSTKLRDKNIFTINLKNDTCVYFQIGDKSKIITKISDSNKVLIYPNPATDHLHFKLKGQVITLAIYDSKGVLIMTEIEDVSEVDIKNLKKGSYFIRIFEMINNEIIKHNYTFYKN